MIHLLNQTCTIASPSSRDEYGSITMGTAQTVKCRAVEGGKKFDESNGQTIVYDLTLTVKGSYVIDSRVVFEGVNYLIKDRKTWIGRKTAYGQMLYLTKYE